MGREEGKSALVSIYFTGYYSFECNLSIDWIGPAINVTIGRSSRYSHILSCDDILHNVTFFSF